MFTFECTSYEDNLKTEWEANALKKNIIVNYNLNTKNNDKNNVIIVMKVEQYL